MSIKPFVIFLFALLSNILLAQSVVNDARSRISISADKKINDKFSIIAKIQARQVENFQLLNRVYFRLGIDYNLNDHLTLNLSGNYMRSRGGFWEMKNAYRFSASATYKLKLSERFSLSNKLMYQTSSDYLFDNEYVNQKISGVIRNKTSFKYKLNRRSSCYVSEELLWQVYGKKETYFGRNRVYIGYNYKLNSKLDIEPYFILERSYNKTNGPQERNFYYCINLNYSF